MESVCQRPKFLVAVDFSPPSRAAFEYALEHASRFDGDLTAVHVLEESPLAYPFGGPDVEAGPDREGSPWATAALEALRTLVPPGVAGGFRDRLFYSVEVGRPATEILRLAEELPADAILLGSNGHSALGELLLGSTTDEVLRRSPCTVIVVRRRVEG